MNLIKRRNQMHVGTHQGLNGLYQTENFVLVCSRTELVMENKNKIIEVANNESIPN